MSKDIDEDISDEIWNELDALLKQLAEESDACLLRRALGENQQDDQAAADFIRASLIQNNLDRIGLQPAPDFLREKLYAMPENFNKAQKLRSRLRWGGFATAAALALVFVLAPWHATDDPTPVEVAQARQELALAFHYLNKVADISRRETQQTIAATMTTAMSRGFQSLGENPEVENAPDNPIENSQDSPESFEL